MSFQFSDDLPVLNYHSKEISKLKRKEKQLPKEAEWLFLV